MLKMGIFHFHALVIVGISYVRAGPQNKMAPRIINGYRCVTPYVPHFVIVRDIGYCGGSLITYEWVLSAAHCMIPGFLNSGKSKIYSGFDMPSQFRQIRTVKEIHRHPQFAQKDFISFKDLRNDIGLIKVDKPFRQTVATQVATLPAPGFAKNCKRVMALGVGITSNDEWVWDKPIRERQVNCVSLNTVDTNTCRREYEKMQGPIRFDNTIMCAHGTDKGVCSGDSGGPVICENVVIGLNSIAARGCDPTVAPSTFTMVETHLHFIDNIIKLTEIKIKSE